jgi:excinuclease UvrABC ATPase subunit
VLYVLDEPSIGLHQRDNARLLVSLKGLRDLGNSVLVVEHDEEAILTADHVIDMGPRPASTAARSSPTGKAADIMAEPRASPASTCPARGPSRCRTSAGRSRRRRCCASSARPATT